MSTGQERNPVQWIKRKINNFDEWAETWTAWNTRAEQQQWNEKRNKNTNTHTKCVAMTTEQRPQTTTWEIMNCQATCFLLVIPPIPMPQHFECVCACLKHIHDFMHAWLTLLLWVIVVAPLFIIFKSFKNKTGAIQIYQHKTKMTWTKNVKHTLAHTHTERASEH